MSKIDLYTYLKENVINIHKKTADPKYNEKAKKTRINATNDIRRETRDTLLLKKRNISDNLSPFLSPAVSQQKKQEHRSAKIQPKNSSTAPNKRFQMLEKWKIERAKKKLEEKQKSKPLFKVYHVKEDIGLPKLDQVNSVVKGKPIKSKFAPANHIFKAPKNIKPVIMVSNQSENCKKKMAEPRAIVKSAIRKQTSNKERAPVPKSSIITRQQSKKEAHGLSNVRAGISLKIQELELSGKRLMKNVCGKTLGMDKATKPSKGCQESPKSTRNTLKTKLKSPRTPRNSSLHPASRTRRQAANNTDSKCQIDEVSSCEGNQSENTSIYVSPFVTISRGKDKARKEFKVRQSSGGTFLDNLDGTTPQAAAEYFTKKLDDEIARIEEICSSWDSYKEDINLPEEALGMIDVAIGQSKLLITKKFPQLRDLIEKCRSTDYLEKPVTCQDLHGYWDTAYIQVEDLDKRFNNLKTLRDNNWQEVLPEKKIMLKKSRTESKKAEASSKLKDMIKAARNKNKQEKHESEFQRLTTPTEGHVRKSLRVSLLNGNLQKKRLSSSPGLTMIKLSQIMKYDTPKKSILKTDQTPSKNKSVIFKDDFNESFHQSNGDNKENVDDILVDVISPLRTRTRIRSLRNINH